jgi:hypothetical protein
MPRFIVHSTHRTWKDRHVSGRDRVGVGPDRVHYLSDDLDYRGYGAVVTGEAATPIRSRDAAL